MKRILLTMLLCVCCLLPVTAAEPYTYTVRFFAGQQGSFGGSDVIIYDNLRYGDRVTFYSSSVTLTENSKYYVKGIRESGKDNNTAVATSFLVTGDMDYVVAYGILGSSVAYTVNYQDEAGTTLAPSEIFYGNVGDRPVVAYRYIEGYQPQAYNLVRTLSDNASENVFTFTYRPLVSGGDTSTGTEDTPNTTTEPEAEAPDLEAEATEPTATDTVPENAAVSSAPGTLPSQEDAEATTEDTEDPREIIDLDDPEVPLANSTPSEDQNETETLGVLTYLFLALGAALLLLLLLLILGRRKGREKHDE